MRATPDHHRSVPLAVKSPIELKEDDAVVNEARDKGTVPCDSDEDHGRAVTDSTYEIVTALVMLWSVLCTGNIALTLLAGFTLARITLIVTSAFITTRQDL